MNILEIEHPYMAVVLTPKQKSELKELIKMSGLNLKISRNSIQISRLRKIYKHLSSVEKQRLTKTFHEVKLRSGRSSCISVNFWLKVTPDLCELYGLLTGDGSVLRVCRFYNSNPVLVNRMNKILYSNFRTKMKKEPTRKIDYLIPKPVQVILERMFGKKGKSIDVKVPLILFNLPKEYASSYIRGVFDADGTCGKTSPPSLTTKSKSLGMGIKSLFKQKFRITTRIVLLQQHDEFILTLGMGKNIDTFFNMLKFYEEVGFLHPRKRSVLKRKIERRTIYKVLQLVKSDIKSSSKIRDILKIDWSTIIDHLNKLEKSGLIKKKIKLFGRNDNLKMYEWYPI